MNCCFYIFNSRKHIAIVPKAYWERYHDLDYLAGVEIRNALPDVPGHRFADVQEGIYEFVKTDGDAAAFQMLASVQMGRPIPPGFDPEAARGDIYTARLALLDAGFTELGGGFDRIEDDFMAQFV